MTSAQPDNDTCPRCGGNFRCGVNDSGPCACSTLKLSDTLLARLREQYPVNCLCLACLAGLSAAETSIS